MKNRENDTISFVKRLWHILVLNPEKKEKMALKTFFFF